MIFMGLCQRQRLEIGVWWIGSTGRNSAQSIQLHFTKNLVLDGLAEAVHFTDTLGILVFLVRPLVRND
jgi:hypothetical protein